MFILWRSWLSLSPSSAKADAALIVASVAATRTIANSTTTLLPMLATFMLTTSFLSVGMDSAGETADFLRDRQDYALNRPGVFVSHLFAAALQFPHTYRVTVMVR